MCALEDPSFSLDKENVHHNYPFLHSSKPRIARTGAIKNALQTLRNSRISPTEFLLTVLDDTTDHFSSFRTAFYAESNSNRLHSLLDRIWSHKKGSLTMKDWIRPHAIDLVCDIVYEEMENAKPLLRMTTSEVTPEFIDTFDVNAIMEPVARVTPVWSQILEAATETKDAKNKNSNQHFTQGRSVISSQAHFLRSFSSNKVQIGIGLMGVSTGISQSFCSVLNQACLSLSHTSLQKVIESLAKRSLEAARRVADGPHGLAYDNLNFSTSIFVEQTATSPNKVQSGTFGVIYELLQVDASPENMELAPMMKRLKESSPLHMTDLRPCLAAARSYALQTSVNVCRPLLHLVEAFSRYKTRPELQNPSRRRLPPGYKTKFHPLRASTIEEASIKGNLHVHDDIYLGTRCDDLTPWDRREVFQLAFGTFHLVMNLIWALLNIHRGSLNQLGSLTHLFAVLEKTRLGCERPDYHTLLAALTQILDGLMLNAWRRECGFKSLDEYAKSKPSSEDLLKLARIIVQNYATPQEAFPPADKPRKAKKPSSSAANGHIKDPIHENVVRLTRDLLYVTELVHAVADGDIGRVEDILPDLACIFRGAGSNNYAAEILHLLFNLKEVWTPEFA
ncbi:hypothetical protein FPV67DRAFT_1434407 [Lyophyllum atratum]|nr:hypothetical protein FPV67DRAFT_1434407 [Lyophyllum atratum]